MVFGLLIRFLTTEPLMLDHTKLYTSSTVSSQTTQHLTGAGISYIQQADTQKHFIDEKNNNLGPIVDHFKSGRLDELMEKIKLLRQKKRRLTLCAITGPAGSGKSELAKAYIAKYSNVTTSFFGWRLTPDPVNNSYFPNVSTSYQQAYSALLHNFSMQQLKAYETETFEEVRNRLLLMVWRRINRYTQWIVIFDNAESYNDIKKYLPSETFLNGLILVTSQQSNFVKDDSDANFSIDEGLEAIEAVQLLKELSQRQDENAVISLSLVKELDFSPLAIRIAGCYIRNVGDITFEMYIKILRQGLTEKVIQLIGGSEFVVQVSQDNERIMTLEMTLEITLNRIKVYNPLLFGVLQYCAYLDNEDIPLDVVIELYRTADSNTIELEQNLRLLDLGKDNYSLLKYNIRQKSYSIHRTTQYVIRRMTGSPSEIVRKLIVVVVEMYPFNEYSVEKLSRSKKVASHLLALKEASRLDPLLLEQYIDLLLLLGQISTLSSQYLVALQYLEHTWNLTQTSKIGHSRIDCLVLQYQGYNKYYLEDYKECQRLLRFSLYRCISTDWHRVWSYNLLGHCLLHDHSNMDGIKHALHAYKTALEIAINSVDPSEEILIEMANSYVGIGSYFESTRNFSLAIENYNQCLYIHIEKIRRPSPDLTNCYMKLGTIGLKSDLAKFTDFGINHSTSITYVKNAIDLETQSFGSKTIHVVHSYYWLSRLILSDESTSRSLEDALTYIDRAIETNIQIFGNTSRKLTLLYFVKTQILQQLTVETQ